MQTRGLNPFLDELLENFTCLWLLSRMDLIVVGVILDKIGLSLWQVKFVALQDQDDTGNADFVLNVEDDWRKVQ